MRNTVTIKNDLNVLKRTLRVAEQQLSFDFDTRVGCFVYIYYMGKEQVVNNAIM